MSNDEFQDIEEDSIDNFGEEFEGSESGSLGDLWKHSPAVKIGVVLAGFVIILGGLILFGGEGEQVKTSMQSRGNEVRGNVGKEQVSPEMQREIEEYNIGQVEQAIETGSSALPVPITPPRGGVLAGDDTEISDDPLQRWRKIQEERQKREQQETPALPEVDPNAETVDALAKAMISQMQNLVNSGKKPPPMQYVAVTSKDYLENLRAEEAKKQQAAAEAAAAQQSDETTEEEPINIIVPAGTIEYGQLLIEANSDTPGPVLAMIASGPLSGSRILGTFKTEDDFLVMSFNTVIIDGVSHSVTGVALDPSTTNSGIVTEYNGRYFKRIFLPAAAEFISGFAEAVATAGTTSVTVDSGAAVSDTADLNTEQELYAGMTTAADKVSDFLDDEASDTKPMVRVAAGTPIGILFTKPVTENAK